MVTPPRLEKRKITTTNNLNKSLSKSCVLQYAMSSLKFKRNPSISPVGSNSKIEIRGSNILKEHGIMWWLKNCIRYRMKDGYE